MRRATILITLVLLMLAVAGVASARDGAFDGLIAQGQPTVPETTTPETTAIEETTQTSPKSSEPGGTTEAEKTTAHPADTTKAEEQGKASGADEVSEDENKNTGKPRHAKKPANRGKSVERGGQRQAGGGGPDEVSGKASPEKGKGSQKVAVCHSGKTLKIGAPAESAHLRHGDSPGACDR